ncbi:MAG: N-acetyltransferase [Burkholderiales bacterium]|nr:N-acetyltransferase [Burkholderiales bacterium]
MPLRLRLLLDTNILIPLQDSMIVLQPNLANFVRLAGIGGHQLLYHPASVDDIRRDENTERRDRTLVRLAQYTELQRPGACPWNGPDTSVNDASDNEILYALQCDAAHALVTEDRGLHAKARGRGLASRVYTIQTAEDWLRRLHEPAEIRLPSIEDVPLHVLTPYLDSDFFDSLREGYDEFNDWFRAKAREGRQAWIYRDDAPEPSAICIYAIQEDEAISDNGEMLTGRSLKLCTFKVGELVRGRKVGELFLKAAFRFASENACVNIFVHANQERHPYLIELLDDFGFVPRGSYRGDTVFVKAHPTVSPAVDLSATDYVRLYYPHYRKDGTVQKYLVPIRPQYHEVLFPDYESPTRRQMALFRPNNFAGNAIKLAYLCHTPTRSVRPGDVLLFYRTEDERSVTTLGVVDRFEVLDDATLIASLVSRRTVYTQQEIVAMAARQTKVFLFRCIEHFPNPVPYDELLRQNIAAGPIQSLRRIDDTQFNRLIRAAGR